MSTILIRLSRAVNRQVTGETIMLCATAYQRNWLVFIYMVNFGFLWKHTNHCQRCWRYERKETMSDDWEQSHLPLDDPRAIHPPVVTCSRPTCGEVTHRDRAIGKEFYNGHVVTKKYYCSDDCHHDDYISRLNTLGM